MPKVELPYAINDADNHFNEPLDLYERYIDPNQRELAIRYVTDTDGRELQLFAGRPSKFDSSQITYSPDELTKMLGRHAEPGTTTSRTRRGARCRECCSTASTR